MAQTGKLIMLRYRRAWLAGGWLLVGLVIYLSLIPHPPKAISFTFADKFEHCFAYASLSLWFCQFYSSARSHLITASALIGMGIALEFIQGWTGYRTFDVWDMVANSIGVLLGFILIRTALGRLFISLETALR